MAAADQDAIESYADDKVMPQHHEAPKLEATTKPDLVLDEAIAAEHAEHQLTVLQAIKTYPKACLWSIGVAMTIVMESYDNSLIGSFFSLPAFRDWFGVYIDEKSGYQIPASWQTVLGQSANIGAFFGILVCGQLAPRFGYRWTTIGALIAMNAFIFLNVFGTSLGMILAGELLCGICWGFFINIAPAYASELAPLALRGVLTSYIQTCWCIGSFMASGVLFKVVQRSDEASWSYKIPFAVQWAWPLPLIILMFFAPESPWWLVGKGRFDEAEMSIRRLGGLGRQTPRDMVAMMVRTIDIERRQTAHSSYLDCFRGVDRRRTTIVCAMFAYQCFTGLLIGFQAVYFLQQAGMDTNTAFALGLGNNAIQLVAVCCCWIIGAYFGRRTIYLWGVGFNIICCLLIGIVACLPGNDRTSYAQATLVILSYLMYGLTIGPVTYTHIRP